MDPELWVSSLIACCVIRFVWSQETKVSTVNYQSETGQYKPANPEVPGNLEFNTCENVTLHCNISYWELNYTWIYWLKDGVSVGALQNRFEILNDTLNTIVIITEYDLDGGYSVNGNYTCVAENEVTGQNVTRTLAVTSTMNEKPILMFCRSHYWSFIAVPLALLAVLAVGLICIGKRPVYKHGKYTVEQNENLLRDKKQEERFKHYMKEYQKANDRRSIKPYKGFDLSRSVAGHGHPDMDQYRSATAPRLCSFSTFSLERPRADAGSNQGKPQYRSWSNIPI